MVAAVVAAVAPTIIKGLFGLFGKKKKTSNTVNYVKMRANAEAAGFNPLTALRNGGSAGFTTTHHPSLSTAEHIGKTLSEGFQAYANMGDPVEIETKRALEEKMARAQLANIQADTKLKVKAFGVPSWAASPNSKIPAPALTGNPVKPVAGEPSVTNPWDGYVVDPSTRDTENFEDRYGDLVGGAIGGAVTTFNDAKANIWKGIYSVTGGKAKYDLMNNHLRKKVSASRFQKSKYTSPKPHKSKRW